MKKRRVRLQTVALFFVLLSIIMHSTVVLYSQDTRRDRGLFDRRVEQERERTTTDLTFPALGEVVDSREYIMGPFDILSVNIWVDPPLSFTLPVTPEGTVIVPTVGEFRVAGSTLDEAKKNIVSGIKEYYLVGNPTVTLLRPRQVAVTVTGNVRNPGTYVLHATDRVETAVERANREERDITPLRDVDGSTRNILVTRRGESAIRADIQMYYATKNNALNPFLREGDIIFVPQFEKNRDGRGGENVIGVYGGVKVPDQYEFVPGDSLLDAIRIAFGFTGRAVRDSVIHSRLSTDGSEIFNQYINIPAIEEGLIPDIPLHPGDRIIVKEMFDRREDYRVRIDGEVVRPGVYPITRNRTRLSEVIEMAGGFTDLASLHNAEVRRRSVTQREIELERLLSQRGGVSDYDSTYYYLETELRIERELVNVNFPRLFNHDDRSQDIFLRSGDIIIIPTDRETIYVYGQVALPGNVPFVEGRSFDYYVRNAGGFTDRARKRDLMVIKRSTGQWLKPYETVVEDGDYIWVPKKVERTFEDYLRMTSQAASVLGVAVSLFLLVLQISN